MEGRRRILLGVAAFGLPEAGVALSGEPLTTAEWQELRQTLRYQRLTGPASAAVDAGALALTDGQREELEEDHLQAMAHVLRLERHLLRITDLLGPLDIPFRVLKGSAVAHLDYSDPALRAFGDNDVLVRSEDFQAATAAFGGAGYDRPAAPLAPGFDVRFGKGATFVDDDHFELDVHRTFAMGPFGILVDLAELWEQPDSFELGGVEVAALGTEQRYLHACYHSVVGNPWGRVQPMRDIAEMLLFGRYDSDRLRALAEGWGAGAVLSRGIVSAWDGFGLTTDVPLLDWARSRPTSRREQRMLDLYRADASYAAKSLGTIGVLPTWRDRASFVRMLAFPGVGDVRSTGRSRVGLLARGARRAARDWRRSLRSH